jgi:hypothetical protein
MKRYLDKRNNFGTIWSARTRHFTIELRLTQTFEEYDGDDNGETQAALDKGVFVMFDSELVVEYDGVEIGRDTLGASVYRDGETFRFIWDGYFRDMLANAIAEAREHFADMPRMRAP